MNTSESVLNQLLKKGINIPCPAGVEIGPDINPAQISGEGVTIHSGCKLFGAKTLILPGVELGYEAPVTINNCQLGKKVNLKGGFFTDSCFLDGVEIGSGAQVREACLLEEGVRAAHCVGLKHTILLPFVTLGSLINFCDCLMAGGTGQENHSEVGSSYIHFNYTPNQDKATASLAGDVPKGVMINQKPIFLGGQGGLVGPVKIGYGVVVGAGNIVRKDILQEDTLLVAQAAVTMTLPFKKDLYTNYVRLIKHNTDYLANLIALRRWYLDIRSLCAKDEMERLLLGGALNKLEMAISERIKRFGQVAKKMPRSMEIQQKMAGTASIQSAIQNQQAFFENWPEMEQVFSEALLYKGDLSRKEQFMKIMGQAVQKKGKDYVQAVKSLSEAEAGAGTLWLQGLVDQIKKEIFSKLPDMKLR